MMSSVLALTMSSTFFTKPSVVFCTLSSSVFLVSLGKSYLQRHSTPPLLRQAAKSDLHTHSTAPPTPPGTHLSSFLRMSLRMLRTATLPSSPILATFLDSSLRRS